MLAGLGDRSVRRRDGGKAKGALLLWGVVVGGLVLLAGTKGQFFFSSSLRCANRDRVGVCVCVCQRSGRGLGRGIGHWRDWPATQCPRGGVSQAHTQCCCTQAPAGQEGDLGDSRKTGKQEAGQQKGGRRHRTGRITRCPDQGGTKRLAALQGAQRRERGQGHVILDVITQSNKSRSWRRRQSPAFAKCLI